MRLTTTAVELNRYAAHYVSPLDSVVILEGAPIVGPDRAEKLIGAIIKVAKKEAGVQVNARAIEMPTGEDGKSKGHLFITLNNQQEAQAFTRSLHEYAFDKKHVFKIIPYNQIDRLSSLDEEFIEPPTEKWVPRVSPLRVVPIVVRALITEILLRPFNRNTLGIGWQILLDEINYYCTGRMTLRLPGTRNLLPLILLSNATYVAPSLLLHTRAALTNAER